MPGLDHTSDIVPMCARRPEKVYRQTPLPLTGPQGRPLVKNTLFAAWATAAEPRRVFEEVPVQVDGHRRIFPQVPTRSNLHGGPPTGEGVARQVRETLEHVRMRQGLVVGRNPIVHHIGMDDEVVAPTHIVHEAREAVHIDEHDVVVHLHHNRVLLSRPIPAGNQSMADLLAYGAQGAGRAVAGVKFVSLLSAWDPVWAGQEYRVTVAAGHARQPLEVFGGPRSVPEVNLVQLTSGHQSVQVGDQQGCAIPSAREDKHHDIGRLRPLLACSASPHVCRRRSQRRGLLVLRGDGFGDGANLHLHTPRQRQHEEQHRGRHNGRWGGWTVP
mmetsp:Transcript_117100/g.335980  ORF Transcript_117100/g.335980 Transcript_117100/m.335980 type:complete len:328 (+) Transcript_117100:433-1416(+)